jgi:tetratricopeptide (TPR) repeat protein
VLDVLDASGGAALTIEVTGHPGRFRFAHALVQHALYDGLGDARRVRAHRRAAQVMGAVSDAALDDRTPALARHWLAAGPADSATAARFARRAGDRALRILAPTQAIRWYEEALCALARAPHDGERARCLVGMGEAQVQVGDPARWDTLAEAARLARRTGDSRLLVRVALVDHHFFSINIGQPDGERISTLEAALAALEVLEAPSAQDTAARVGLLLRLAVERSGDGDHVGRRHLADEALRRARRMGDPLTLLQALIAHSAIVAGTDAGELRRQFHEIDDLAGRIDDPAWKFWSAVRCGATSLLLGDGRGVRRHIGHASALAATVGNPSFRRAAALHHGWVALLAGRPHDAERLANEMLQIGLDTGEPDVTTVYAGQLFAIRWHQGRLGQMLGPLEQLAEANRDVPAVRAATALALVEGARDEEAGALLASEVASGFVAPEDWLRSTYLAHWADVAEHLAHADAAALLYELLAPHPAQVAFTGGTTHGAQAHPLGALAAVLGRVEEAHHHFALALDIHERLEAPFHIARTSLAWARLLLEHGDDHHVSRARDLLTRSAALADRHGYAVVGRRAAAALGRLEVGDHRPRAGAAAAR